jgi:hypothetical protein
MTEILLRGEFIFNGQGEARSTGNDVTVADMSIEDVAGLCLQ